MEKDPKSLQPKINHNIDEEFSRLIDEKITPWAFFNTGKMPQITDHHGKTIRYSGVKFEASPELVFWDSFIDPFLRSIIVEKIDWAIELANSTNIAAHAVLEMIESRLKMQIQKTYTRMSEIDQRIRGEGFPERVQRRDVSDKVNSMYTFLDDQDGCRGRCSICSNYGTAWGNVVQFIHLFLRAGLCSIVTRGTFYIPPWVTRRPPFPSPFSA